MSDPITAKAPFKVKLGMAQMTQGGLITGVVDVDQAILAEQAGACAVVVLKKFAVERQHDIARPPDPKIIKAIMEAVSIPVISNVRVGHFVEAQIMQEIGVDMIDESEVLTRADNRNHIDKQAFNTPFVCGATSLGDALRRISEGAVMIRTEGYPGSADISETVQELRNINRQIKKAHAMPKPELYAYANEINVDAELLKETAKLGRLPVVLFAAGGIATPADVAMLMQLGADGVMVGSGIFQSANPQKRAEAMVQAVVHYNDPKTLAMVSEDLGEAMVANSCRSTRSIHEYD